MSLEVKEKTKRKTRRIMLVLDNIRSSYNVGAILRSGEGFGVEKVLFDGITPMPQDPELLPHLRAKVDRAIVKSALGAEAYVCCERAKNLASELAILKKQGWQIVGLENNLPDKEVFALGSVKLEQQLGEKLILLLGEETKGIRPELLNIADVLVEIPMRGNKESFNVSVAAGIALFGLT